jgi:hypothetical protein
MGLDVYGYVVFGKVFDKKDLEKTTLSRSCEHDTDLEKPFCSQCGKKVFEEIKESILEKLDDLYDWRNGINVTYFGDPDKDEVIIGVSLAKTASNCNGFYRVASPSQEMMVLIKTFLEENNLPLGEIETYLLNEYSI